MSATDNQRIAKNTVYLYLRTFVSMLISLYTSRKILEILGISDFGILNVVGGVIAMLAFLNNSLSVATQRFLTYELGRKEDCAIQKVFSMAAMIHGGVALLVLILGETVGLWFVNTYLQIPSERMFAANVIYQVSILSAVIGIIQTPYNAAIVSHEAMHVYAWVGLGESFAKLLIVFLLLISPIDKLISYSALFLCVQLCACSIYRSYCHRNYKDECRISLKWTPALFRSMAGFTGWNMFGTVAWMLKDHGANILLNIFGGPAVNAARGVASQINNATNSLVGGFQSAVNPQLTKNYASDDKEQLRCLMCRSSKFSYYLMFVIALPVLFECEYLLNIWLVEVPAHAVLFARIIILEALAGTLSGPMVTSLMATGRIKWYQIVVGSLLLLNIPISYAMLKMGFHISTPLIVSLVFMILGNLARLVFCKRNLGLSLRLYASTVIAPISGVTIVSAMILSVIYVMIPEGWIRLIVIGIFGVLSVCTCVFSMGMSRIERRFIVDSCKAKVKSLKMARI